MKAHELHRDAAPRQLGFHIVTVSTSRYRQKNEGAKVEDESGDVAQSLVNQRGHKVVGRELISDDSSLLRAALRRGLGSKSVDVIIFIGGTGISPTDITIETVKPAFEKEIEGFGELLRSLSYQKIGAAAMLTRATAGIAQGRLVLCLPGSPDAVGTALIGFMDEIPHSIFIARGKKEGGQGVS